MGLNQRREIQATSGFTHSAFKYQLVVAILQFLQRNAIVVPGNLICEFHWLFLQLEKLIVRVLWLQKDPQNPRMYERRARTRRFFAKGQ